MYRKTQVLLFWFCVYYLASLLVTKFRPEGGRWIKQWDRRRGNDTDRGKPKYTDTKSNPCHRIHLKSQTNHCRCALVSRLLNCLDHSMGFRTVLFWVVTQRVVANSLQKFRDSLSVPSSGAINPWIILDSWTLQIGPLCGLEMSIRNYHYSLCNNSDDHSSHLLSGGSLKSRMAWTYVGRVAQSI
jgi:hypothetical protein